MFEVTFIPCAHNHHTDSCCAAMSGKGQRLRCFPKKYFWRYSIFINWTP